MKYRAIVLALAILARFPLPSDAAMDLLEVSWEAVLQNAVLDGKCIYVAFLGDGWSVASSRFSRTVLESDAFREYAGRELGYCPTRATSTKPY